MLRSPDLAQHLAGPWWAPGSRRARSDRRCVAAARAGRARRAGAMPSSCSNGCRPRRRVGATGFSAYEVRHAVARPRCRRGGDDSRHARQRRASGVAGATPTPSPSQRRSRSRSRRSFACGVCVPASRPFRAPLNLHVGRREVPLGLLGPGLLIAASAVAMMVVGDVPSIATARSARAPRSAVHRRRAAELGRPSVAEEPDAFDLLPAAELSLDQIEARPGNVLVPGPQSALAGARGGRAPDAGRSRRGGDDRPAARRRRRARTAFNDATPTPPSGSCSSKSSPLAERHGRPVRLLVVPARNVVRRHRRDDPAASLVRRARRRIVDALGRRSGAPARRSLGAGRQAGPARRPPRRPSPQRAHRYLSSRRPPAVALARRSRSDSSRLARCDQGDRARTSIITTSSGQPSRKWNNNSTAHNATRRWRRSARRPDRPTSSRPCFAPATTPGCAT